MSLAPGRQGAPNSHWPGGVHCVPHRWPGRGLQGDLGCVSRAAICGQRLDERRSCQYSNPPTRGLRVGTRDPNGQASQTRLGAPAEPDGRKAKLPRAGPGAPGLCRPLYRLLCRDSKKEKLRPDVTTCPSFLPLSLFPPSSFPSSSSILFQLSPLSPRCQVPLGHQLGQGAGLASAHQSPGTGVGASCPQGGLERRWGVPGLREAKTQEERGCRVTIETRARSPRALLPSPRSISHAPNAHPGVGSEADGCGRTGPPPARRDHSLEWRVGHDMTALRPTLRGPRAVNREWGE